MTSRFTCAPARYPAGIAAGFDRAPLRGFVAPYDLPRGLLGGLLVGGRFGRRLVERAFNGCSRNGRRRRSGCRRCDRGLLRLSLRFGSLRLCHRFLLLALLLGLALDFLRLTRGKLGLLLRLGLAPRRLLGVD